MDIQDTLPPHENLWDGEDDDEDFIVTWSLVDEIPFKHWRSSDGGRGIRCFVRREVSNDTLGKRLNVIKGDETLFVIHTWRDQWGLWIWGEDPGTGEELWEVAQEDNTPSLLGALIQALTWLKEDDLGTGP